MRIGISTFAIGSSDFAQQATKLLVCVLENYDPLHRDLNQGQKKRGEKKKNFKSSDAVHAEICLQTWRTFQFLTRAHKERGWNLVRKNTDSLDHKEASCLRPAARDYEVAGLQMTCGIHHNQPQGCAMNQLHSNGSVVFRPSGIHVLTGPS